MIGCYDFCGHYEWTFGWLERRGGEVLVKAYWETAISHDASRQARELIIPHGIAGMREYWRHTLEEEAAGYDLTSDATCFRIDMHACPSKGFLLRNGLQQHGDYCDHCIGWIGPVMEDAGFVVDHEHNHRGQCWWEFRRRQDPGLPSDPGAFSGAKDVRLGPEWNSETAHDVFRRATNVGQKSSGPPAPDAARSPSPPDWS